MMVPSVLFDFDSGAIVESSDPDKVGQFFDAGESKLVTYAKLLKKEKELKDSKEISRSQTNLSNQSPRLSIFCFDYKPEDYFFKHLDMFFDKQGNLLYTYHKHMNCVLVFNSLGDFQLIWEPPFPFQTFGYDHNRNLLLAVSGTSNEYEPVNTSSCGELIQISLPLKKDSMTTPLTLTKEGSIYRFSKARAIVVGKNDIFIAENLQNGSVQKVNIQTEIVTTLCDNLRYPNSMVIWSTNPNILFVTLSSKYIFSIDVRTGKKETLCGTNKKNIEEPFGNMGSICCDDKGKLFVCELSKRRIRVVEVEKAANEQLKAKVSLLCGN